MTVQTIGTLLRAMRKQRRLTQEKLAARTQVTARTLRYWETDQQQPRDAELESVLKALNATQQERAQIVSRLTDRRSVRLSQSAQPTPDIPLDHLGPLPGIGDLIRAMRLRRDWTQEELAEAVGARRGAIIRWETTHALPAEEDMVRLCAALRTAPEEQEVLMARRLHPATWSPQLSLEECKQQYDNLVRVRREDLSLWPLVDLYALALKRQLRFLLGQHMEAIRLLALVELTHSGWLFVRGRRAEAAAGEWRTLNLVRGKFAPEIFWLRALNMLAAHAATSARGAEDGLKLLYPWVSMLPSTLHPELLCDLAYYAGKADQPDEAEYLLKRAGQVYQRCQGTDPNELWYYRMTKARVLLSGGRPVEAMDWLPPLGTNILNRIFELLIWAEVYLAAGEKTTAAYHLTEVQGLLALAPLPLAPYHSHHQRLKQLTQHL
jgi:transcriptional regulator with XRE-family HTH domain